MKLKYLFLLLILVSCSLFASPERHTACGKVCPVQQCNSTIMPSATGVNAAVQEEGDFLPMHQFMGCII